MLKCVVRVCTGSVGILLGILAVSCRGVEDSCFVAGTLIATPTGPRPIESLASGDLVWSYDLQIGLVARSVRKLHRARARVVCRVELGRSCIRGVTPSHPLYDAARGEYVALRDLTPESRLLHVLEPPRPSHSTVQQLGIVRLTIEEAPEPVFSVFNLSIEGPEHNYIADGVLVHNKGPEPDHPLPGALCGDGILDGEECDDGNQVDGDDCNNSCERYDVVPKSKDCAAALDVAVPSHCESGISFSDPDLERLVRAAVHRPDGELLHEHVARLRVLYSEDEPITELSGVECLTGLRGVALSNGGIAELAPLSKLTELVYLTLDNQQISNVEPLSGLCALELIGMANNTISDISALAHLPQLVRVQLENNQISDPTPLTAQSGLIDINLSGNPLATLEPLARAAGLQFLHLDRTLRTDLAAIGALTGIYRVSAAGNGLRDLEFLRAWDPVSLASLRQLVLSDNLVEDLTPLVDLERTAEDALWVYLQDNPIDCEAQAENLSQARERVGVETDCPYDP